MPSPTVWLTRSCCRSHLLPSWGGPGAGPPLTPACRPRLRWPPWPGRPRGHGWLCRCGRSSRLWAGLEAWITANIKAWAGERDKGAIKPYGKVSGINATVQSLSGSLCKCEGAAEMGKFTGWQKKMKRRKKHHISADIIHLVVVCENGSNHTMSMASLSVTERPKSFMALWLQFCGRAKSHDSFPFNSGRAAFVGYKGNTPTATAHNRIETVDHSCMKHHKSIHYLI